SATSPSKFFASAPKAYLQAQRLPCARIVAYDTLLIGVRAACRAADATSACRNDGLSGPTRVGVRASPVRWIRALSPRVCRSRKPLGRDPRGLRKERAGGACRPRAGLAAELTASP